MIPAPFIVGIPRSGTTLLRLMLDAHPDMAIPTETYFINQFKVDERVSPDHFLFHLREDSAWVNFDFFDNNFVEAIHTYPDFTVTDGIREFHLSYADSFGKTRWGNKSPDYLDCLKLVEHLVPEARFIHMIRDGRDVSLSQHVASGHQVLDCVKVWTHRLYELYDGYIPQHYLEVKFDDLILEPAETLKIVCDFIELDFNPSMLYYHKYAIARMENIPPEKARWFDLTQQKPDVGRLEVWRRELSQSNNDAAVRIAGSLLDRFGYDRY